jgi:26S proteasome regulatory subunit N9
VQFVALAAAQISDPKAALSFLETQKLKLKDDKNAQDAYALATMETAHYHLVAGDLATCKSAIAESEKIIEALHSVAPSINATFYRVSADYYKISLAYPQYYHHALLFLSSVNMDSMPLKTKQERAHDLALSALLGEGLYNFGELVPKTNPARTSNLGVSCWITVRLAA